MLNKKEAALFEAIKQNDNKSLLTWLEEGGSPDAKDNKGNSLIELLATNHNLEGMKILSLYNPDINKTAGNYNNIMNLVETGSTELENFVQLEKAFYEEDFNIAKVVFRMHPSLINVRLLYKREQPLYKQIIEFGELKLKGIGYMQNNPRVLSKYIHKLDKFCEFIKTNQYFFNKPITISLENEINKYNTFQESESNVSLSGLGLDDDSIV